MDRRCEFCEADISHRHFNAVYCEDCARQRQEIRRLEKDNVTYKRRKEQGLCTYCGKREPAVEGLLKCEQCRVSDHDGCILCDRPVGLHRKKYCDEHAKIVERNQISRLTDEQQKIYEENKELVGRSKMIREFQEAPDEEIDSVRKRILAELREFGI